MKTPNRAAMKGKKDGILYSTETTSDSRVIRVELYFGGDPTFDVVVGRYTLEKNPHVRRRIQQYYPTTALERIPNITPWSGWAWIQRQHRGQHLSELLVEEAIKALEEQGGTHIETFSASGEDAIMTRLQERGYEHIPAKRERRSPLLWRAY